jgi:nucleotide-binding universal stress UspA family protein
MFKHILLPTDGSELSRKAVTRGVALAKSLGAKVTGLFAAPPATPIIYRANLPVGYATPEQHQRMIEKTTAKTLEFVENAAKKAGLSFEGVHVTSDFPADEILKIADRKKCDLIVMATHGQGGLRGLFLGSVTQKVLNKAKLPVLIVR